MWGPRSFALLLGLTLILIFPSLSAAKAEAGLLLEERATGDICALLHQSVSIVGGKLFFARGSYSFDGGDTLTSQPTLYSIDLNATFPANSYISTSTFKSIGLPSGLPFSDENIPAIFYDNTTIYFISPANNTAQNVWTYNVSTSQFAYIPVAGGDKNPVISVNGAWASDPASGISYFTGTSSSGLAKRAVSPSLQLFNSSTPDKTWTLANGPGTTFSSGVMVYVRAGRAGILVAFGGVDPNDHTDFASSSLGAYRSMTDIYVFDIFSNTWYRVAATGAKGASDIPNPRISFCAGVSAAPDDSSFQITIFGGFNLHNSGATSQVHVLTLPTFQWINVTSLGVGTFTDGNFAVGRQSHQCAMWQEAQMIVLGGIIQGTGTKTGAGSLNLDIQSCNQSHPPLLVLDMSTFQWRDSFQTGRTYSQPAAVSDVIGGDNRGLSEQKAPPKGFNDTALDTIFAQRVQKIQQPTSFPTSTTSTSTSATPTSSSTAGPPAAVRKLNVVPIAIGIGGGLFVIGCLVVGWILWSKKRKRDNGVRDLLIPEMGTFSREHGKPMHELQGGREMAHELPSQAYIAELDAPVKKWGNRG